MLLVPLEKDILFLNDTNMYLGQFINSYGR